MPIGLRAEDVTYHSLRLISSLRKDGKNWRKDTLIRMHRLLNMLRPRLQRADVYAALQYASFVDIVRLYLEQNPSKDEERYLALRVSMDIAGFIAATMRSNLSQEEKELGSIALADSFAKLGEFVPQPNLTPKPSARNKRRAARVLH